MKVPSIVHYLAFVAGLAVASAAPAADKPKQDAAAAEKAAMEAMAKAGQPGDAHKKLAPLAGTFEVKAKSWMDPSKPPEETTATTTRKWILGNRYLEEDYNGSFMGQPFTGLGIQGYDNVTKRYVSTWMDTMTTGMMNATGTLSGKTIKFNATMVDPATGKSGKYTMNLVIADNDHHTFDMWGPGPDGKNVKWMELSYTRKK